MPRRELDFDARPFMSANNGDDERAFVEDEYIKNIEGNQYDTLAAAAIARIIVSPLPGHELANLQDYIARLLRTLDEAEAAINPRDRTKISLHEWNQRLKVAASNIRDVTAAPDKETGDA